MRLPFAHGVGVLRRSVVGGDDVDGAVGDAVPDGLQVCVAVPEGRCADVAGASPVVFFGGF